MCLYRLRNLEFLGRYSGIELNTIRAPSTRSFPSTACSHILRPGALPRNPTPFGQWLSPCPGLPGAPRKESYSLPVAILCFFQFEAV